MLVFVIDFLQLFKSVLSILRFQTVWHMEVSVSLAYGGFCQLPKNGSNIQSMGKFYSERYESGAPNLLSSTWLAAQGERNVLLGATKDWGSMDASPFVSAEERSKSLDRLFAETTPFYPSILNWEVIGMQAGLRAMPPRSALGSLPLVGCIDDLVQSSHSRIVVGAPNSSPRTSSTKWWLFSGLGSRGLIHHGWLGEQLAKAVMFKNECMLPHELKQW